MKSMKFLFLIFGLLTTEIKLLAESNTQSTKVVMLNSLNLENAKAIARTTCDKAQELGISVAVSIYDNHGNLKYFERMDGTPYGTIRTAHLKAKSAASFGLSTKVLGEFSASMNTKPFDSIVDVTTVPGGLPIYDKNKNLIGAIGVGGGAPDQDEACAQAGIDGFLK